MIEPVVIANSPDLLSLLIIPLNSKPMMDKGNIGTIIDMIKDNPIDINLSFSRLPLIKVPIHLPIRNKYTAAIIEPTVTRNAPINVPKYALLATNKTALGNIGTIMP